MNAIEKVQNTVVTVKKRTAKKVLAAISQLDTCTNRIKQCIYNSQYISTPRH